MKQKLIITIALLVSINVMAQNKYISVAAFNTQTAMPFGKFIGSFTDQFHPGIEATWGKNFSIKKKHDWFWDIRAAWFFHRFVQHGIPLYSNIGYRYKFNKRFSADVAIGGGYMQSIPATAKLKLNSNGEYVNNKGVGRVQAIAAFGIGAGYTIHPSTSKPMKIFINYQQRIQMPFVKSYVPLLPYNSFMIGISCPLKVRAKAK
jgi:hypothetical protein